MCNAKDCEQCNSDNICCTCQNLEWYKLKQTLIEIKEIAESEMDSKEFMAIQCMLNGSVDNKNKVLKQILQKISEVIPNEN